MVEPEPNDATPFLPERRSLKSLREAAAHCRGCHLWRGASQTVFGEGSKGARLMLVGEQPGDQEDRQGRPFVGDRKSTRLNSSHDQISYAVFCLKKKKKT